MVSRVLDIEGADPLDSSLDAVGPAVRQPDGADWPAWRLALGLAPSPWPSMALLLTGAALGPSGLALLTPRVLEALAPAVAVALVALGALVGLDVDVRRRRGVTRLVGAAGGETLVTLLIVSAAAWIVSRLTPGAWPDLPMAPLLLGVCAAASATRVRRAETSVEPRVGDLDDLLPIMAAGGLLVAAGGNSVQAIAIGLGLVVLLSVAVALAGALLVEGGPDEGEQRVYALGALLLLTGVATYLSASALFVGATTGAVWNSRPSAVRERLARDVRYLQHPVVVVLLVVAGALAPITWPTFAAAGVFALARVLGKVIGGAAVARLVPGVRPDVGLELLGVGVVGVGCALDFAGSGRATGAGAALLGIVAWGAVASDLLAMLVSGRQRRRA